MQPLLRSVLYVPAHNIRAIQKAQTLPVDAVLLDLEDAILATDKPQARQNALDALQTPWDKPVILRINSLSSPWGLADVQAAQQMAIHAIAVPKVEQPSDLALEHNTLPLWAMIETPRGVLGCADIAAQTGVQTLVLGTSDLQADLRTTAMPNRENLWYTLSRVVLCARAYGLQVLDGVHNQISDLEGLEQSCIQARQFGFDGKTLIHPKQIDISNRIFAPSPSDIASAQAMIAAWEAASTGVTVWQGHLVEELHVRSAQRLLAIAQQLHLIP